MSGGWSDYARNLFNQGANYVNSILPGQKNESEDVGSPPGSDHESIASRPSTDSMEDSIEDSLDSAKEASTKVDAATKRVFIGTGTVDKKLEEMPEAAAKKVENSDFAKDLKAAADTVENTDFAKGFRAAADSVENTNFARDFRETAKLGTQNPEKKTITTIISLMERREALTKDINNLTNPDVSKREKLGRVLNVAHRVTLTLKKKELDKVSESLRSYDDLLLSKAFVEWNNK